MRDALGAPVTAVVSAHNEATHIGPCVESLHWAAEVLVIENDSTDETAALARAAGATVISNPEFVTLERQRNLAIARAAHEWVFVLDADERCTPELAAEIDALLRGAPPPHAAYRVRRLSYFLGKLIRHSGWERDRPVRLFRSTLRYEEAMHGHVAVDDAGVLRAPMIHYPYEDLDSYFEKLVRYSRMWAEDHFARGRRASAWVIAVRPPLRFLTMYVLRLGFLDGAHGVLVAALGATSVAAKYARLWELTRGEGSGRREAGSGHSMRPSPAAPHAHARGRGRSA